MVYIKNLDKDIFPLYIPPEEDEVFSSWICRLSTNHGVKTQTFFKNFFQNSRGYFSRDIDVLAPNLLLETLLNHTPLNEKEINNLFLKSYEGFAFERINSKTLTLNILPLGTVNRAKYRYGAQVCVSCLNKKKYFKKQWRLITSILCVECQEYLIDKCPNCNAPIHFFKINKGGNTHLPINGFQPLNICYNCLISFKDINQSNLNVIDENHIEYQKYMNMTIRKGYNIESNYSFLFIKILLILSSLLRSNSHKGVFKKFIELNYYESFNIIDENISFWEVPIRAQTLPFVFNLLHTHKEHFFKLLNEKRIAKSYISSEKNGLPYWFEKNIIY